jgi:GNAT superfamily N-acetyltransferase
MDIEIVRLSEIQEIKPFDCEDSDLNEFLLKDAQLYQRQLLAVTYIWETDHRTVLYFCLLNDKVSVRDLESGNQWKKRFKDVMPEGKKFTSYPAVKIGRLGTDKEFKSKGLGTFAINAIKDLFISNPTTEAKYLTVDAYRDSIPFYEKNGFVFLTNQDKDNETRLMYFDLMTLVE